MLPAGVAKKRAEETRIALQQVLTAHSPSYGPERKLPETVITCEDCPHNDNCDFAWDLYNTDGDCLAMK